MINLEELLTRVHNPEVRPLVRDAHRAYANGIPRAAIVLTWTAVCADLMAKAQALADDGEPDAKTLAQQVENAQKLAANTDEKQRRGAIPIMLKVEQDILDTALKLELIDSSQHVQLDRLRDDRHQSAHPSLRPLGELYEPTAEYARAHLVAALDALLIHPPSQGRKVWESFSAHVADPGFVLNPGHLTHTYFDRVRPSVRNRVVEFAARFAVLEIDDPNVTLPADQLADRMADCLRCFASHDTALAEKAVAKHIVKLEIADPKIQFAALARLGTLPAFWKAVPETLRSLFASRIEKVGEDGESENYSLSAVEIKVLGLVTNPGVRAALPELETAYARLHYLTRAELISRRPDPYYVRFLPELLTSAWTFNSGDQVARDAVLPSASFLDLETLPKVLRSWWDNGQCWGWRAPGHLEELYQATAHLGTARDDVWRSYLEEKRDSDSLYRDLTRRLKLPALPEDESGS